MKGAPPCLEVNLSDNKCFVGFIFVRWRGTSDLAWMCVPLWPLNPSGPKRLGKK